MFLVLKPISRIFKFIEFKSVEIEILYIYKEYLYFLSNVLADKCMCTFDLCLPLIRAKAFSRELRQVKTCRSVPDQVLFKPGITTTGDG